MTKGAQGNGGDTVEKRCFANGKEARQTLNGCGDNETYRPLVTRARQCDLWAVFLWLRGRNFLPRLVGGIKILICRYCCEATRFNFCLFN